MEYWTYKMDPVRYTDDLYYIGSNAGPAWLIKSADGLILLDTGFPQTTYQLTENLRELGYTCKDVKHIIHSHGHIDHVGATRAIVEISGAKTYIGEGDADMVRGKNQLQWTNEFGMPYFEPFEPDVLIKDGDKIKIGDKTFYFRNVPGHTQGTLAIFFNVTENGKEYRAGMFGGAGLNTMSLEYLDKYNLPRTLRDEFLKSLKSVYDEKVEVHLGNHLGDNKHREKVLELGGDKNPFLDGSTWKWFLDKRYSEAEEYFKKN